MKTYLLAALAAIVSALSLAAHEGVEIGPNGGRVLGLGKQDVVRGEVTLTNGQFHVILLDKNGKSSALKDASLTVVAGDRKAPQKPSVEKQGDRFVFAAPKGDDYPVVLRFKENAEAKPVTARFQYDAEICSACKNPEWLCKCGAEDEKQPKDGKHQDHDRHSDHGKK